MPILSRGVTAARLLTALATQLAALHLVTGCGGASPAPEAARSAMAEPAMQAAPPPPPAPGPMASPSPAAASMGYAPPSAPEPMGMDAPAPAPAAIPGPAPAPPRKPTTPAKAPPPHSGKTGDPKAPQTSAQQPQTPAAPMLIYVGEIQLEVADEEAIPVTIDKIIDIADGLGGYLAGRKDTSVQVRIPSARFREGFTMIEKLARVTHRSVSADDVSEKYSDLEVRLQNLKATQKRLQEFLAKAGTVQEMLSVGRELERVAGEIEVIEGKMRFLRSRAAFSLVTVGLQPKPKTAVVVADKKAPPPPRDIALPVAWLSRVGLDRLLNLH